MEGEEEMGSKGCGAAFGRSRMEKRKRRENLETRREVGLVERADFLKIGELTGNAVIGVHGGCRMQDAG